MGGVEEERLGMLFASECTFWIARVRAWFRFFSEGGSQEKARCLRNHDAVKMISDADESCHAAEGRRALDERVSDRSVVHGDTYVRKIVDLSIPTHVVPVLYRTVRDLIVQLYRYDVQPGTSDE